MIEALLELNALLCQPMLDLRRFKEVRVSYASRFVKQMLNLWSFSNRLIPQDWRDLVTDILEPVQNDKTWWKEEALTLNNGVELEVWKSPNINFLEKEIMLICKGNLYMMATLWFYVMQQL